MMKSLMLAAAAAALVPLSAGMAAAGPIEKACMRSGRDAANRALCSCIQDVADITLRGTDQRRAAKFFRDPDEAHEVWVSQRAADDLFWDRYKEFGAMAEARCGG